MGSLLDTWDVRCFNPRLWHVQASGDQGTDYFGNPIPVGRALVAAPLHRPRLLATLDRPLDRLAPRCPRHQPHLRRDRQLQQPVDPGPAPRGRPLVPSIAAPGPAPVLLTATPTPFPAPTRARSTSSSSGWPTAWTSLTPISSARRSSAATAAPSPPGFPLTITAPTIEPNTTTYYTLDGTDPRLPGGAISATRHFQSRHDQPDPDEQRPRLRPQLQPRPQTTSPAAPSAAIRPSPARGPARRSAPSSSRTPPLAITEIMYHPRRCRHERRGATSSSSS